jgi:alpha-N-acetylglucosamine transferase
MSNNIWCTLVMLNDKYAPGAAVVAKTLRNVNTKYPIWCMIAGDVSQACEDFLRTQFDNVIRVPLISHECIPMKSKKQNEIYGSWIAHSFTKWNIFDPELFPVNKVILVDADMLFLHNCDELFDLPAPALTFSTPWAQPYTDKGIHNYYFSGGQELQHGKSVPHSQIVLGLRNGFVGCANMVLVTPNQTMKDELQAVINKYPKYGHRACCSGFDEQSFADVVLNCKMPVYHIHQRFNWYVGKNKWLLHNEQPKTQQYYNTKPWQEDPAKSEWEDVREWWDVAKQVITDENRRWFEQNDDSYAVLNI